MARLACLMSKHSLISELALDTMTTGFTHGVGPLTGSMISISTSSLIFRSTAFLRLNGIRLSGCAAGFTLGSMCKVTWLVLSVPIPANTFKYLCCSACFISLMAAIFKTSSLTAVSFTKRSSPFPLQPDLSSQICSPHMWMPPLLLKVGLKSTSTVFSLTLSPLEQQMHNLFPSHHSHVVSEWYALCNTFWEVICSTAFMTYLTSCWACLISA